MWTYIIIGIVIVVVLLLCFALAVANFSYQNHFEKLKNCQEKRNTAGLSTLQYVQTLNNEYFNGRLRVAKCPEYEDHYSSGVVALSDKTMQSNSLASLAIVSHELGHARQDMTSNKLKKHWQMLRAGRICGLFFMPLLLAGLVLLLLWVFQVLPELVYLVLGLALVGGSVIIFAFAVLLKYKEIQIEKEASQFAIEYLRRFLIEPEIVLCQDLLKSALLTYWVQLIRTLLSWTMLTNKTKMFR